VERGLWPRGYWYNEWIAAQGAPLMEIAPDTFFRAALAVSAETTEEEKLI